MGNKQADRVGPCPLGVFTRFVCEGCLLHHHLLSVDDVDASLQGVHALACKVVELTRLVVVSDVVDAVGCADKFKLVDVAVRPCDGDANDLLSLWQFF